MRGVLGRIRRRLLPSSPRPLILMYHRVAHPAVDPWGLAVRPERFEEHLAVLRRSRRPLRMSEFLHALDRGTLPSNAVAVTFDDGYADNLLAAQPRLAATDVPATLFVMTGAVGQRTEYWWDELARSILLREAALDCEVVIGGERCRVVFGQASGTHDADWRAWQAPRTPREAAYADVWRRLRAAPAGERNAVICQLRDRLGAPAPRSTDLPLSRSELAALAADGLFEIAGHTVTHPVLPALDPAEKRREISEGKIECERFVNRPIAGFAYPHGAVDADCRAAVEECGFAWACSTESRAVSGKTDDRYALPRLQVLDWDGDTFDRALRAACA